jgi:hypothetical protein
MYAGFTEVHIESPSETCDLSRIDLFYQKKQLLQHLTDPTITQDEKLSSFLYWEKMQDASAPESYFQIPTRYTPSFVKTTHCSVFRQHTSLLPQWEAGGLFHDWEQDI